jgi:microcystin-dependent protein
MARNYSSLVEPKTLTANVGSSDTQITLNNVTGLPSRPYVLVLNPDTDREEAVLVTVDQTGVTSPTLKVQRAIEASGGLGGAKTHSIGHTVKHMIVGSDLQLVHDHIDDSELIHGINIGEGSVVGTLKPQTLTNKTLTTPKINENVNLTATSSELNILDGATLTTTELNYVDGVTSAIQTQMDTKAPSAGPTFTGTVVLPSTTSIGTVSATEIGYVDGVTSSIQTQIGTINTALTTNTPIGSITMWATATPPTGWLLCNGQSTASYTALAAVVGATVPDMQGLVPVGFKTSDDAFGTLKGTGGSKTSTAAHTHGLASHTHSINHDHGPFDTVNGEGGHQHTINTAIEITGAIANGDGSRWLVDAKNTELNYLTTASNGAHNHNVNVPDFAGTSGGPSDNTSGGSSAGATNGNLQPYFTLNFIIKH